jgi:hypothetical protein
MPRTKTSGQQCVRHLEVPRSGRPDGVISRVIEGWNKKEMASWPRRGDGFVPAGGQCSGVEGGLKFAQLGSRREPR